MVTRRPHIVLEALQVRPNPTGTGRGIIDLCRALAGRDRGMDFSVLATHPGIFENLEQQPGWRVIPCRAAQGGSLRKALFTQFRLPGLVRDLGGDLLHCMQFLAPLRCPCPLVATVHDLAWMSYPETIEEPRRSYYRWLVPRTLSRAAAITVNSRSTAAETGRLFPGVAERIKVTPHGTPAWVLDRAGHHGEGPKGSGRPFFLFVGTMEPRKNLARLLDAYEAFLALEVVRNTEPGEIPTLVFVGGKGWKDSALRARLAVLRERNVLEIHDYADDDTLWGLYGSARALVFPSLHEGFGLPILEAMAARLPVLTSDRGGMREIAGEHALLVDPENVRDLTEGLRVMAFDRDLRDRLADGGPDRARKWNWEHTADQTVQVYDELLDGCPAKKPLPRRD